MSTTPTEGSELFTRSFDVDRDTLVRYAGASGDFNPIHYNDHTAEAVGLPGVIAHGMLTMGLAATALTDWAGDPGAVLDYQTRFTRPVVVPNPGSVTIDVRGIAGPHDPEAATLRIDVQVTVAGKTVLAKTQALLRQ